MFNRSCFAFAALALTAGSAANAQLHEGDISLLNQNGQMVTGKVINGSPVAGERVFPTNLGDPAANLTNNPGFDCNPGFFPVPSAVGFRVRKALRAWDGSSFSQIPSERMNITFATLGPVVTPAADPASPIQGFTVSVQSNGQWHRHLVYRLRTEPDGGTPADGIYLLEMELFHSTRFYSDSPPFWILFNQNRPLSELNLAANWVRSNLVNPCFAECDGTQGIDINDFFCFLSRYASNDQRADINRDGAVDITDFFAYLTAYAAGCP